MNFNQNQEIFMAIDGFPNYEISNFGRVRNAKTGRILKPAIDKDGYYKLILHKNSKKYNCRVHRLVAEAFVENPNNYETVDHIDQFRQNNHYSNLRWANSQMQSRNTGLSSRNTSNIKGVRYYPEQNHWRAFICNNNGTLISKSFSINKYDNAKERCIEWRKAKEIEFEYTPV